MTAFLPPSAVANGTLPNVACYISDTGTTWLAISHTPVGSSSAAYCGLTGIPSAPGVTIVNGIPGWFFYIIAVW